MTTIKIIVAIIITLAIIKIGDKNKMADIPSDPFVGSLYYDTNLGKVQSYLGGGALIPGTTTISQSQWGDPVGAPDPVSSYQAPAAPVVDPYAQWGGRANYDAQRSGFAAQKQGIFDSANTWGDNAGTRANRGVLDLLQGYGNSQDALNRKSVNNEASRIQGTQGILGVLGRGIKSGMTMLGNRNAGSSSAAGALARAYGDIARRDQSGVNNQYETGNEDIAVQQGLLRQDMGTQRDKFKENLDLEINAKVEEARSALSALDAQIAGASLPDRIAIDQEKQNIKNQLIAKLQGYDQQLSTGLQGINPASREANLTSAQTRLAAGQVPESAFSFNEQIPAQFQSSGGQASGLPLFTMNKRRQTA